VLKQLFPLGRFGAPATDAEIAAIEAALGVQFPEQLRTLYLECDGFRENKGNAKYLLSLTDEDSIGSLKTLTQFCWSEFKETWPELDLSPFVFFGSSAGDELWGIRWRGADEIIAFSHHMEGAYETRGTNIVDVYKADYEIYGDEV
jgi:hypothetical protein